MLHKQDYAGAVEMIGKARNVLITTHTRPDGDALGCVRAVMEMVKIKGGRAYPLILSKMPRWYEFLFDEKVPVLGEDISGEQLENLLPNDDSLVVIADTNSYVQLPGLENFIKQNNRPILVIDHHVTTDGLGSFELVDTSAPAAGKIVYDLFTEEGIEISRASAEALFTAMATDTGWFRFAGVDAGLYDAAAKLIEAGVSPNELYNRLYLNYTPQRFALMKRMLDSLEFHFDEGAAVQVLTNEDFRQTGAEKHDTENLIDECQRLGSVHTAVLFVENKDENGNKVFRCSMRSKGKIDVRKIAQKFGGGGHRVASGATVEGDYATVKSIILEEIEAQLR